MAEKYLVTIIRSNLASLVNNNYIFLDLPYYTNIGDVLIWKGTEDFLNTLSFKCLYKSSIENYVKPEISKKVIILLQGGGNFGDIWRRHTDFCLQILQEFPENRIIILPQTVYYRSTEIMHKDANLFGQHKHVTICARDNVTYDLLSANFTANSILRVPDMAFCINASFLNKYRLPEKNKVLFLRRKDQEYSNYDYSRYLNHKNVEEREWPSMEKQLFVTRLLLWIKRVSSFLKKENMFARTANRITDLYAQKVFMPYMLKTGIRFISEYKYVYSTRLHGAILSTMLDKPLTFFDNSYGKNNNFYKTWLQDFAGITFITKEQNNQVVEK